MEPIELPTCYVSMKDNVVNILLKKDVSERENHTLARRVVGYLRSEGFLTGHCTVLVGTPNNLNENPL